MTRIAPPSAAFYRDLFIVLAAFALLVFTVIFYPQAEQPPHVPPADQRWEPAPLSR